MFWSTAVIIVYAIFCIVGGIIGYLKADSLPSLLAGTIGGVVLLLLAGGIHKGNRIAAFLCLAIALAFGIRFGIGLFAEFRVMPHLVMVILSLSAAIASLAVLVGPKGTSD